MVVPQVGISGFRIDLGIRNPDLAGAYLAGVECDGATYHGSATARDRDKVREQVLTGLGWNILRVWSTDWWFDAKGCAERLHEDLQALLQKSRDQQAAEETANDLCEDFDQHENDLVELKKKEPPTVEAPAPAVAVTAELVASPDPSPVEAALVSPATAGRPGESAHSDGASYSIADLSAFKADPSLFYEFTYRDTLKGMIETVMHTESPLRTDVLAQRIARVHGWLRTGGRIRERIDLHLRDYEETNESSGVFLWKKGSVADLLTYRPPVDEDARRSISEIAIAELASVVVDNPDLLDMPDTARDMARLLGVERLAATARSRLDEAIARARLHLAKSD